MNDLNVVLAAFGGLVGGVVVGVVVVGTVRPKTLPEITSKKLVQAVFSAVKYISVLLKVNVE